MVDTKSQWYYDIHPERYVPALKDWCSVTEREVLVFESTACLQYLAEEYDQEGIWRGKNTAERAVVLSWTAFQTAGLGKVTSSPHLSDRVTDYRPLDLVRSSGCIS